jgi:type I restriction enzyme, S subunit
MAKWKKVKLGDVANVKGGKRLPFDEVLQTELTGHPYIRVRDLNNKRILDITPDFEYINEITQKQIENYIVNTNDIVLSIVGTIGLVSIIGPTLNNANLTENCVKIIDLKNIITKYLYYFLSSVNGQNEIKKQTVGAVQQKLPLKNIKEVLIPLPDIVVQQKIAGILSSLDDKIELNNRINGNLEQQAQVIFKEWFVIDKNKKVILDDLVNFDPFEKIERNQDYLFFDMKCLSSNSMNLSEGILRKSNSASSFRNDDVLLAKITPCLENGKTGFVNCLKKNQIARGSTEFIVLRKKSDVSPYWIYCLARNEQFREVAIKSMVGSSGRQRVQINVLRNYEVFYDQQLMRKFDTFAYSLFQQIAENNLESQQLSKIRDTLLPKLMNGEIEV